MTHQKPKLKMAHFIMEDKFFYCFHQRTKSEKSYSAYFLETNP